jgi:hypothetical protein
MIWDIGELQGLVGFIGKLEDHLKGILAKTGKCSANHHCSVREPADETYACYNQLAGG